MSETEIQRCRSILSTSPIRRRIGILYPYVNDRSLDAIYLHVFQKMKYVDIGHFFGITGERVSQYINRAYRQIGSCEVSREVDKQ